MQPYLNPNYFNQYQPMQNPYMDRMAQLQQYQQSLQQPVSQAQMPAIGKIVDSIDVVKATDIPMDGNAYYFPKADGTEVYCKQWLQNGTTRILTFKPVFEDNPNNLSSDTEKFKISLSDDVTAAFMKRFDDIEKRLDEFAIKSAAKTSTSRTKKEADAE